SLTWSPRPCTSECSCWLSPARRLSASTLFPYTTLFRSRGPAHARRGARLSLVEENAPAPVRDATGRHGGARRGGGHDLGAHGLEDRKSTRLNSSHVAISYAVFCL